MGLRDELQHAQQEALKNKQTDALSTLRLLWSSIRTEEINQRKELSDDEIIAVVARQMKQLREALVDFTKAGRADLVAKTEREMNLLSVYLPQQLTDEELHAIIMRIISAGGPKDVGKVMGLVMKEVQGRADGNRVRELVTQRLSSA